MKPYQCLPGRRVLYIPNHVDPEDRDHPDIEIGVVSKTSKTHVWVAFHNGSSQCCECDNLYPSDEPNWLIRWTTTPHAKDLAGVIELPSTGLTAEGIELRRLAVPPILEASQKHAAQADTQLFLTTDSLIFWAERGLVKDPAGRAIDKYLGSLALGTPR